MKERIALSILRGVSSLYRLITDLSFDCPSIVKRERQRRMVQHDSVWVLLGGI